VSNEHQEQGAKTRNSRGTMHRAPTVCLSNAAIDVQGQRKTASYGLSRYKQWFEEKEIDFKLAA